MTQGELTSPWYHLSSDAAWALHSESDNGDYPMLLSAGPRIDNLLSHIARNWDAPRFGKACTNRLFSGPLPKALRFFIAESVGLF